MPDGLFTEWLFSEARVGDAMQVAGPFGDFLLHEADAPMLCVAGGSGLAPVLSMLQGALKTQKKTRAVTLFFGARTQQDLYMLDAIEALRQQWPLHFEFVPVLSSEPANSDWQGRRGLIGDHFAAVLGDVLIDQHAYMCGPPLMIDSCAAHLVQAGVAEDNIHFDKFLDQSHLGLAAAVGA